MNHIGLFEGIGGFSLAARWAGWETIAWCEWNPFGQKVLSYHFPKAKQHGDITATDFSIYRGQCDIVTGGFPCQPYSVAGKRKGKEDDRHLWPQMLRAIKEIQPRWVVGENVLGLVNWDGGLVFHEVQTDLESAGYEVFPYVLPACGVNAPHKRDRVWFIAYANDKGRSSRLGEIQKEDGEISQRDNNAKFSNTGNGITADTNYSGTNINSRIVGNGQTIDEGWNRKSQPEFGKDSSNGSSVNTRSTRIWEDKSRDVHNGERNSQEQVQRRENIPSGTGATDEVPVRPITHAASERLEGEQRRASEGDGFAIGNWNEFPTQPPLCTGNDGFSSESLRQRIREDSMGYLSEKEIDKIISKAATEWRNESIKAGGNAIVPQVVYQIFKAINKYEENE